MQITRRPELQTHSRASGAKCLLVRPVVGASSTKQPRAPVVHAPSCAGSRFGALRGSKYPPSSSVACHVAAMPASPTSTPDGKASATWTIEVVTWVPFAGTGPSSLGLELTAVSVANAIQQPQLISNGDPKVHPRAREDLPGRCDSYTISLPADFEPAAIWLKDLSDEGDADFRKGGKYERLFISCVTFTRQNGNGGMRFTAQSYIAPDQGRRLFVRDDAFIHPKLSSSFFQPTKPDDWFAALLAEELESMRGEGSSENQIRAQTKARAGSDRIYRFATYDDLEKPNLGGDILRPVLGGSAEYPYPRRLDTNRGRYPGFPDYELPPTDSTGILGNFLLALPPFLQRPLAGLAKGSALPVPWVPVDDNFDPDKSKDFIGGAVVGALPSVLSGLDSAFSNVAFLRPLFSLLRFLNLSTGPEFKNIGDVLDLYDKAELTHLASHSDEPSRVVPNTLNSKIQALNDSTPTVINLRSGTFRASTPAEAAAQDQAAASLRSQQKPLVDLLKYKVPRCLYDRVNTWPTDEEFGRLFLAGQNPVVIQAVNKGNLDRLLGRSGIRTAADLSGLTEGKSLEQLASEATPRLFAIDYWSLYDLLDAPGIQGKGGDRVQHAGRCVLFRRSDGHLVPVAIELASSKAAPPTVYTAADPKPVWRVAKALFLSVDSGYHQLISHWLRTHAAQEPFWIATRRQLSPTHPIYRLMMPHFKYTGTINAAARSLLVNREGVIESCFSPGPYSMQLSSKIYGAEWQFKNEGLLADLRKRGFVSDGSTTLNIKDYPYAEDGLLIWGALERYFTAYVRYYYSSDEQVLADRQLQAWWKDVREGGHPDKKDGWIELVGRDNLVHICATIAWISSAHHAAVNFGQYDFSGFMPLHSPIARKAAPARDSDDWKALVNASKVERAESEVERLMLQYLALPSVTTKMMTTVRLLSAHAEDEQYLSSDVQDYLPRSTDPKVESIFQAFLADMNNVEKQIEARNADPQNLTRNANKDGMPYTLLLPSSGSGITSRGVPYSISI